MRSNDKIIIFASINSSIYVITQSFTSNHLPSIICHRLWLRIYINCILANIVRMDTRCYCRFSNIKQVI